MKKIARKILNHSPQFLQEYFEWIFSDASENQIRIARMRKNTFHSFTELKKHQKRARRFVALIFLVLVSLFVGFLVGPTFFPQPIEPEVYIPNGKGDILIGNISKNQVTVFFKTLDGANGNKPLATRAVVEVFNDKELTNLVRRTKEDEYAVTHVILVDSLQENNIYYIRISAVDSSEKPNSKEVSTWGGNEPIQIYTSGELIPECALQNETKESEDGIINKPVVTVNENGAPAVLLEEFEEINIPNSSLHVFDVQNENHLQPQNKVQTIISWNTNVPASTVLIYGEGSGGEKKEIVINRENNTKHAAVLTTLKAGTTYYFIAKSIDENGISATSEEYSLRTPRPKETIVEKISDNFKGLLKQIKPN
jgi:hypothetical protein